MKPTSRPARLKWFDLHPFFWVAQPVLFLYARAVHEVGLLKALIPLAAGLAGAALLLAVAHLLFRCDLRKSALLTSASLILFFSFGHFTTLAGWFFDRTDLWPNLRGMNVPTRTVSIQAAALAVYAVIGIVLLARVAVKKPLAERTSYVMGLAAAVLLFSSAVQIVLGLALRPRAAAPSAPAVAASRSSPAGSPDIYLIVMDGYARADILREFFHYDNAPFLSCLEELGFSVKPASRANYAWTFLSLASALNMVPMTEVAEAAGPRSRDQRAPQAMIGNNRVQAFLRSRGYRSVHIASAWSGTRTNPYADEIWSDRQHIMDDDFTRALVDSSLLAIFNGRLLDDLAAFYADQFDNLEQAAAGRGPKMVFAHFMLPHPPYLFDRTGAVVGKASFRTVVLERKVQWGRTDAYIEQLRYVNTRLLAALRSIIEASAAPPVVLLVSDHGPLIASGDERSVIRARLGNLTAALLPGARPDLLAPDISLIEVFPIVLNHYFQAGLPIPSAESYFSLYSRPYELRLAGPEPEHEGVQVP